MPSARDVERAAGQNDNSSVVPALPNVSTKSNQKKVMFKLETLSSHSNSRPSKARKRSLSS